MKLFTCFNVIPKNKRLMTDSIPIQTASDAIQTEDPQREKILAVLCSPSSPCYDGTINISQFVDQLNALCDKLGINNENRLLLLPILLRNATAEIAYESLPKVLRKKGPWNQLTSTLCDKVFPTYMEDFAIMNFQNLTQGQLSVGAFADFLKKESLKVFSAKSTLKDTCMRVTFLRGLRPELQLNVLRARPTTLDKAVEVAKLEESIMFLYE